MSFQKSRSLVDTSCTSPLRSNFPCALKGSIFWNKKSSVLLERKTLHPVHAIFWFGVARLQNGFEDVRLQTASETILFFKVCDGVSECLQQAVFRISVPRSIHLTPSGTRKKKSKKDQKVQIVGHNICFKKSENSHGKNSCT